MKKILIVFAMALAAGVALSAQPPPSATNATTMTVNQAADAAPTTSALTTAQGPAVQDAKQSTAGVVSVSTMKAVGANNAEKTYFLVTGAEKAMTGKAGNQSTAKSAVSALDGKVKILTNGAGSGSIIVKHARIPDGDIILGGDGITAENQSTTKSVVSVLAWKDESPIWWL